MAQLRELDRGELSILFMPLKNGGRNANFAIFRFT